MSQIARDDHRTDILNRLRRAEGQLRGIQRMVADGEPCQDIASQMAAVRRALDSAYVRMTVCFMQQELSAGEGAVRGEDLDRFLDEVQSLLGKMR